MPGMATDAKENAAGDLLLKKRKPRSACGRGRYATHAVSLLGGIGVVESQQFGRQPTLAAPGTSGPVLDRANVSPGFRLPAPTTP
jgi:hypothetical protein